MHPAEALVITHIFQQVILHDLGRPIEDRLVIFDGRQRRRSYQPRATPWVKAADFIRSAESAIHHSAASSLLRSLVAPALRRVGQARQEFCVNVAEAAVAEYYHDIATLCLLAEVRHDRLHIGKIRGDLSCCLQVHH